MQIQSISAHFPSKVVDVDATVSMIEEHSRDSFNGDLRKALALISRILTRSGAQTRRWLAKDERPIEILQACVRETLESGECEPDEVDLLIYTGLGRGFIEPAQSYMVARSLGMHNVECFDIIDACMSWVRALNLAYNYLRTGTYQRVLIVNGEFLNVPDGPLFPENYALESIQQLTWTFPTYTLGSAATATLLAPNKLSTDTWKWCFGARTDWADLCTIPLSGFDGFTSKIDSAAKNGIGRLTSFGDDLHKNAGPELVRILHDLNVDFDAVKLIFPHASSSVAWDKFAKAAGVSGKLYHIYPKYGNLVSASVPASIAVAKQEQHIQRGDRLVGWVGSAGLSFSAYAWTY